MAFSQHIVKSIATINIKNSFSSSFQYWSLLELDGVAQEGSLPAEMTMLSAGNFVRVPPMTSGVRKPFMDGRVAQW